MNLRFQHTHHASIADASRSQWLPLLRLLTTAALISAAGCTGSSDGLAEDTSDTYPSAAEKPSHPALRNGVVATPETIGGFSADGVGVYLSAIDNTAELTLYVVTPAQSATFGRPALYLTTQEGDHSKTDVAEFDDVTVEVGESRVFRAEAEGTLMEVFADFAGEEG
jgi:hypothetical protein